MSLKLLQTKAGVKADGVFGPNTMKAAMQYYKMTPFRASHFFAQTSHETGNFKIFTENLNYSANGLLKVFGKYFKTKIKALEYQRKPEKIANLVYGSRMNNGNEASGDGWRFRGRGALQLTGRSNYQIFADHLDNPEIMVKPDLVESEFSFESAIFFFDKNKLWNICDEGVSDIAILKISKRINGGTNGLADRIKKTKQYYNFIK
jgi:putative chitinase